MAEKLTFHPYAEIFPLANTQSPEFLDLVKSLEDHGMLEEITLYNDMILDGRTRYMAYLESPDKIALKTKVFTGNDSDALSYSFARNRTRRNLNEEQAALAAYRYARLLTVGNQNQRFKEAATKFRIGRTMLTELDYLHKLRSDTPEVKVLLEAIEQGECEVTRASKIAKSGLKVEQWKLALENKSIVSQAKRMERERKLAVDTVKATRELQELGKDPVYGVIYIDPPWPFDTRSEAGKERSAEQHYPTMSLDDIRGMPIPAADNCVMLMWTSGPQLAKATEIMEGWGFEYKSFFVWIKDKIGLGYWTRGQCELLLLGTKGEVVGPNPGEQMAQVIETPRLKHSEKPEVFADGITKLFPNVPKLEMFSRGIKHKGENWFYWGNEVNGEEAITNGNGKRKRKSAKKAPGAEAETIETESTESGTSATA